MSEKGEAMKTVAQPTTPNKPAKAFYAHLWAQSGVMAQDSAGQIWFLDSDTQELIAIEPTHCPWITVLGEVGLSETQALLDAMHGAAPWICTHRAQEVA
jgi:hypothetical protein